MNESVKNELIKTRCELLKLAKKESKCLLEKIELDTQDVYGEIWNRLIRQYQMESYFLKDGSYPKKTHSTVVKLSKIDLRLENTDNRRVLSKLASETPDFYERYYLMKVHYDEKIFKLYIDLTKLKQMLDADSEFIEYSITENEIEKKLYLRISSSYLSMWKAVMGESNISLSDIKIF